MADFCRACWGEAEYAGDLAGITPKKAWNNNKASIVMCEGCGAIQVDPDGNCVSQNCLEKGKPGHGLPWKQLETTR